MENRTEGRWKGKEENRSRCEEDEKERKKIKQ